MNERIKDLWRLYWLLAVVSWITIIFDDAITGLILFGFTGLIALIIHISLNKEVSNEARNKDKKAGKSDKRNRRNKEKKSLSK